MFYVVGIFRTLGLGDSISNDYERTALRRQEEQPGYTEALQQRASSLNIKRLLLIKENQISQVKKFSAFLCMGRCKSLGSWKSFLWYAPQLYGANILSFSSWVSSRYTAGVGYSGWGLASGQPIYLHPELSLGLPSRMAAVVDDCNILCLLIWQVTIFPWHVSQESRESSTYWSQRNINYLSKATYHCHEK